MADVKRVYTFGNKAAEGNGKMRELLGGKGANLAEMNLIGIPVPPGFTITTEVCTEYYAHGKDKVIELLRPEVERAVKHIEQLTNMRFGDKTMPLLVSVRSGARASMPGMMDTILNLGMNDVAVEAVAKRTGNPRFAWDSYRRFVQMYGDVVLGMKPQTKEDHDPFEVLIEEQKAKRGVKQDTELTTDDLKELVAAFKAAVKKQTGGDFPADPWDQLWGAVCAVFGSWMNERAILYRKLNNIPAEWGTAVSVQAMVFGNMGENSATGVAFSRDAATGENIFNGEYLINAQGEDVVAGIRTPQQITVEGSKRWAKAQNISEEERRAKYPSLEEVMPAVYKELDEIQHHLEKYFTDMQDIEFTIQDGKLWMPQRQAHGRCDGQNRHGHAARRADRRENRRAALRACQAGRVAAPRLRQDGDQARRGDRQGFARIAGRRDGAGGLLRRRCRKGVGQDGSKGGAGAYRDFARRFEGDARRCGYPHRTRRYDVARGGRCARYGQVLRVGCRRVEDRLQGTHDRGQRLYDQGGRLDFAQRFNRRGLPRPGRHA